jgi:hypothetical protein
VGEHAAIEMRHCENVFADIGDADGMEKAPEDCVFVNVYIEKEVYIAVFIIVAPFTLGLGFTEQDVDKVGHVLRAEFHEKGREFSPYICVVGIGAISQAFLDFNEAVNGVVFLLDVDDEVFAALLYREKCILDNFIYSFGIFFYGLLHRRRHHTLTMIFDGDAIFFHFRRNEDIDILIYCNRLFCGNKLFSKKETEADK